MSQKLKQPYSKAKKVFFFDGLKSVSQTVTEKDFHISKTE